MSEFFSNGGRGEVYRISTENALRFPHADLHKIDRTPWQWHPFSVNFYAYKIANVLFPDNVISIHGYSQKRGVVGIFSSLADVPAEHALYSAHMVANPNSYFGAARKKLGCDCESCKKHHDFHKDLLAAASRLEHETTKAAGITLPFSDWSDYCLANSGHILFFEIEALDLGVLEAYLHGENPNSPRIQQATSFLTRLKSLAKPDPEIYPVVSRRIRLG